MESYINLYSFIYHLMHCKVFSDVVCFKMYSAYDDYLKVFLVIIDMLCLMKMAL